jgi:hypothetical protein
MYTRFLKQNHFHASVNKKLAANFLIYHQDLKTIAKEDKVKRTFLVEGYSEKTLKCLFHPFIDIFI